MRSGNLRNFVVAALATVATVWATGCAQGVGTVDRTQAHRIDKSWLNDGKPWYFLQTVVDAPPTTNFTFVGESSFPPDRIVWSVQENWLYAYRNYEWIKGSQQPYSSLDHGTAGGSLYYGAPIAAYKITSHFDVQRDYNAQTGEQTNVIEENTTDRPWYQRQYMHVDWSNNGLNAFDFLSLGLQNSTTLQTTSVAYYPDEEDPNNKDRAEVTPNYIGIVNKMTYQAELDAEATQQLGFPVYKCFLWTNVGIGDCGPGEVKVRLSFKKIEDDHDFFPRNYTDKDVNMFGVWTQQQAVYDPERGYLTADFSANQMAVMHHIWQKDHLPADPVTHLACDIHDYSNPNCEMPLNQRSPKPIVYYVSESWPALGDPNHKTMWLQAKLLADEYNDDMRGVVAAARRGGPPVDADPVLSPMDSTGKQTANFQFLAPDVWAAQNNVALTNTSAINYRPDGTISYSGAKGLDFLAYPPDTRQMAFAEGGYDAMVRPNVTLVNDNGDPCTAAQVAAGGCTTCDPTKNYCMGIGHLPYTVVPRMFTMCHNPVQPRVVHQGDVLPDGTTYSGSVATIDKSDPSKPESYDFSTPGDPSVCDARADGDRKTAPLNPQLGDLRYHMLAWVPQPDISAPGGIGEPAMDPVTGEIISAHAYIYSHAVEGLATYGADLLAILNGWENVNDYVQGNMVKDYIIATQNRIPPIFSGQRLTNYLASAPVQSKIQNFQYQVNQHLRDPGGVGDVEVANWKRLSAINDPRLPTGPNEELLRAFAPDLGLNSSGSQVPQAVQSQFTYANLLAPDSVATWDQADSLRSQMFAERHILDQSEIEPTAVRLAQYYKTQLAPGAVTNPCTGDSNSPVYRTCVWEAARQDILGNLWRSYSDHEVGHTFGQFHNFAGSTDALNYFDPYWAIRQENTISVSASAAPNTPGQFMFQHLGSVPSTALPGGKTDTAVLAPEFMQAPTQQSLLEGLREYQYTSIMDYNSKFNADFQGIGKYDHACHMYQYGRQVEVFDPDQLSKVPANNDTDTTTTGNGQATHQHQVADELLIPFNRHYTFYPWLINDGLASEGPGGKKTPLAQAISKMIHARKWVSYSDLMNGISSADQAKVNGFDDVTKFNGSLMVPYRFCSDYYNQGQAHCLWFDEGADPYEQAIGFINSYKLNYFFNNFKHGSQQFAPQESSYTYLNRLWQRTFQPLVRIFQHALNDEFIVRFDPKYTCLDGQSPGGTTHVNAIQCGMDRLATQATIMDFYAKILQTPNAGEYGWVTSGSVNTYCSTESGHCNPGTPDVSNGAHPALTLAPGDSSKYDESQWDINKYGHLYMWQPTVLGNFYDKWYAIKSMTSYDSYIIGAENSKPFNYLISMASWFDQDVNNAIGGLFVDDQNWAPRVAYYAANPGDPDHPPFTMYQNTEAIRDVGAANVPNDAWCPSGTGAAPPGLENCPANLSFTGQFDHDATQLAALGYTTQNLNPGPVYYERTLAIQAAVIYMTSTVDNLQFLRTIKVNMKGSGTFDNTAVQALSCADGSACVPGTQTTCENGATCSSTIPCSDFSLCLPRAYTCTSSPGAPPCAGVCMDPSNPTVDTCNPAKYAEFTDMATGNTYFATVYNASKQAPFGGAQTVPYYSIGYELVKQSASAARLAPNQPLSSVQLLDILRALYYYWSYDPYFAM